MSFSLRLLPLLACCLLPGQQILQSFSSLDFDQRFTPIGDRNGDGYDDVLLTAQIFIGPYWNNFDYELRFHSGQNGALLRRGLRWSYPDGGVAFRHGDHDGDGIPDYICRDTDYANAQLRVSVRSGLDDHVIWIVQKPFHDYWAFHVIGDLDIDGDGLLDVVVSHPVGNSSRGEIWAYDHWGNQIYHLVGTPAVNSLAQSLAKLGDVDGDGCDDYIAGLGDPTWYGAVAVISGRTGQFLRVVTGQQLGDYIGSGCIGCGDLDGNGLPDFAAGGGLSGSRGSVQAFSSRTGARLFATYSGYVGDRFGYVLRAADYDQDGIDDIVSASWGGMYVVSGRDGSFLALYVPNSTASLATFEAQPLATPLGFPRLLVRTQVLGTHLMTAEPRASEFLGQGCQMLPGIAQPRLGMRELSGFDRRLTLSGAEPGTVAFLLLGFAARSTGPTSLAPIGWPACAVHPSLDAIGCFATGTTATTAGFAQHEFAIPSATTFGLGIDAQWVTLDGRGVVAGLSAALRFAIRP